MSTEIITLESIVGSVSETFSRICVDPSIHFQRESEFALQVLYGNDYSKKIAIANPQSVRDAVTNIAAIGISLNPAKKQAYLVPRKGGICLDISYIGLTELAVASGSIRWAKAELVREQDSLTLNGFDKPPTHTFNPFAKDRGEVVGVYCIAKTFDGDYLTDTMTIDEVHDIRNRSEAWKAFVAKGVKCPWATDPGEMIKKTIIKRSSKMWPKTDRLDQAVHYLNTDGDQGIDFASNTTQAAPAKAPAAFSLSNILARLDAAEDDATISAVRAEGLSKASESRDKVAYDRIRAAVAKRRIDLGIVTDINTTGAPA